MRKFKSDDEIIKWAENRGFEFGNTWNEAAGKYNGPEANLSNYFGSLNENVKKLQSFEVSDNNEYRENLYYAIEDLDPDKNFVLKIAGKDCSADGMHSIWRISCGMHTESKYYENSTDIIDVYEHYRKVPIFFFPRKGGGINQTRAKRETFKDRIDLFLFYLKEYFENHLEDGLYIEENLRMIECFNIRENREWIEDLEKLSIDTKYRNGFEYLMDEIYDVRGIFVDNDYNVLNIETGEPITNANWDDYKTNGWTRLYYENLKVKIDEWYDRQGFFCD